MTGSAGCCGRPHSAMNEHGQLLPRGPLIPEKLQLTVKVDVTPQIEMTKVAYWRGAADGAIVTGIVLTLVLALVVLARRH